MFIRKKCIFFIFLTTNFSFAHSCVTIAQLENVTLRCYNGPTTDTFIEKRVGEAFELSTLFDPLKKETHIYIHGYHESPNSNDSMAVITAYVKRGDINICAVNWEVIAAENYVSVATSAECVGQRIAEVLNAWVQNGFDVTGLRLIGFSMGAQICGFIGRKTTFKVPRITGLEPAGPFYNIMIQHLECNDAVFVDAIHTDMGEFGTIQTVCADFYPNGGYRTQPGCPLFTIPLTPPFRCSHERAVYLYSESLLDPQSFIGVKCTGELDFLMGKCKDNEQAAMGYATPTNASGYYYLVTNSVPPYGREEAGTTAS